jgi:hypothetical protein
MLNTNYSENNFKKSCLAWFIKLMLKKSSGCIFNFVSLNRNWNLLETGTCLIVKCFQILKYVYTHHCDLIKNYLFLFTNWGVLSGPSYDRKYKSFSETGTCIFCIYKWTCTVISESMISKMFWYSTIKML